VVPVSLATMQLATDMPRELTPWANAERKQKIAAV
jgi:hypothetical protein